MEVHKAQAMCYAYMYAAQQDLPKIQVRMTYCNLETEDLRYFRFSYDKKELEDWFGRLMGEYEKWARFQADWRNTRQESIRPLEFPFPYREGQKDLAYGVYRTIARKKRLFIQAPTGVGKTMSAVFPAVKAMGEGLGEKKSEQRYRNTHSNSQHLPSAGSVLLMTDKTYLPLWSS